MRRAEGVLSGVVFRDGAARPHCARRYQHRPCVGPALRKRQEGLPGETIARLLDGPATAVRPVSAAGRQQERQDRGRHRVAREPASSGPRWPP